MFKDCFKYYKSKNPQPSYDRVLNFNEIDRFSDKIIPVELSAYNELCHQDYGLKPLKFWKIYKLRDNPGLIFIKNPFTNSGQRYWVVRCLIDYTRRPNKSNLDPFNLIPSDREWWEVSQTNKAILDKLRWITLGYHHNWDTKVYSEESRGEFPDDLHNLCRLITQILGYENFNAQAAIVNYYHLDSTLSGHTDYSEQDLEAPLISFSFGQTAIFLLGGKEINHNSTTSMFLESGDIVIMSKESRLCYHGVPKIVKTDQKPWLGIVDNYRSIDDYLEYSRININVRQVLKSDQKRLNDSNKC